jgi:hypothetical protein
MYCQKKSSLSSILSFISLDPISKPYIFVFIYNNIYYVFLISPYVLNYWLTVSYVE